MGIREEHKKETRRVILESAKSLLLENGFVKVSTKEISSNAGVAQGSIFLHFTDKETLLNEIISTNIKKLHDELLKDVNPKSDRETFLSELIEVLGNNEDILSRVYKDYDYLSDKLKKNVEMIEKNIKNMIFDNIRVSEGKALSILDSFILIDAFYSQIMVNLLDKDVYSTMNSVLRNRRGKLSKLFRMLFE